MNGIQAKAEKFDKIVAALQQYRGKKTRYENSEAEGEIFVPYDYWGGNTDDCYEGGCEDGEIGLARQILSIVDE